MDILLTHTTALEAMRSGRLRWRLEKGERCDASIPERVPDDDEIAQLTEVVPELAKATKPLELLVARDAPRTRRGLVRTHASAPLPSGSAFEVASGVRCVSPEHLPVVMSSQLTDLELIYLLSELLGLYAVAPDHEKGMFQRRDPLTTPERILAHLDSLGPEHGTQRVRRMLGLACVRSGSPRETKLSLRLGLRQSLGGYGLEVLSMNEPIEVRRVHDAMKPGVRKPDILLRGREDGPDGKARLSAVEYDGRDHATERAHASDAARNTELRAIGISEHVVTKAQYDDLSYMDGLAEILRRELGQPSTRVTREVAERRRRRRLELYEELERIDGIHWDGRARQRSRDEKNERSFGPAATAIEDGWDVVPVEAYGLE